MAPAGFVKVIATAQNFAGERIPKRPLATGPVDFQQREPAHRAGAGQSRLGALFGRGLAVQGRQLSCALGESPSHPELLDTLAVRFVQGGWSVKQLIRDIMLSRAYQISSEHQPAAYAKDPDNQLIWRMNRRRLEAEAIRDAMLAVSGNLDFRRPEGSPVQKLPVGELGRQIKGDELYKEELVYRMLYLPLARGYVPEFLNTFDVADPELVVGQRDITTVATQVLYLMNNPQARVQCKPSPTGCWQISRLTSEEARIEQAFQMALGRPATTEQKAEAREFLSQYAASLGDAVNAENNRRSAWANFCQALFASASSATCIKRIFRNLSRIDPRRQSLPISLRPNHASLSRRQLLTGSSCGFGYLAFSALFGRMQQQALAAPKRVFQQSVVAQIAPLHPAGEACDFSCFM